MKKYKFIAALILLFMIPQSCVYSIYFPSVIPIKKIQRIIKKELSYDFDKTFNRLISIIDKCEKISVYDQYIEQLDEEQVIRLTNLMTSLAIIGSSKIDYVKKDLLMKDIEDLYVDNEDEQSLSFMFKNYYPDGDRNIIFSRDDNSYELIKCTNIFKKSGRGIKKGAKKTGKFIVDHKNEILIGIGVVVGVAMGSMIAYKIFTENDEILENISIEQKSTIETNPQINDSKSNDVSIEQNGLASCLSNNEFQAPIPENKLSPIAQNSIECLKDSISSQIFNLDRSFDSTQETPSIDQFKDFSRSLGSEIAHTVLDIAAVTGEGIDVIISSAIHEMLDVVEDGFDILNLLGEEFRKEITNISGDISLLLNQEFDQTNLANNQNIKDSFEKAHEKVDEFFSTDMADTNRDSKILSKLEIPFLPFETAEGAVIGKKIIKSLETIKEEATIAENGLAKVVSSLKSSNFIENGIDLQKFADAGRVLDRAELTKAGRALAKHGGREGSVFPKPSGTPEQINKQGQDILESILNNPASKIIKLEDGGIKLFAPDGKGLHYDNQGFLKGFVEAQYE